MSRIYSIRVFTSHFFFFNDTATTEIYTLSLHDALPIGRTVNAFFGWEFNSCETLVKDGGVHPIDYANACPDVSLISLHYYFPWAIKALLRWTVYCCVTGRKMRVSLDPEDWFALGDSDRSYADKLEAYRELADRYFEVGAYEEFCDRHLGHLEI